MAALLSLTVFHITFRVAEPEGLARHLRFSADGVTDQGWGAVTSEARNAAGKPVLGAVAFPGARRPHLQLRYQTLQR